MTPRIAEQASFGARLVKAGEQRGRLCVGIDPHPHLLEAWGLDANVDGLRRFTETCVEAFADTAALVKPQVAFYEAYGSAGFVVLEEALAALRQAECLTVADAKRGDIGSTMAGYATAWLAEDSPLRADAVTVSPYLGFGSLSPVLDLAEEVGGGVFVLAATSNPEAAALQNTTTSAGKTIAQGIVDACAERNAAAAHDGGSGYGSVGSVGVVVGATLHDPPWLEDLNGPVLLPGVGAQGATMADAASIGGTQERYAFPNVSRAVLQAGPKVGEIQAAMRQLLAS